MQVLNCIQVSLKDYPIPRLHVRHSHHVVGCSLHCQECSGTTQRFKTESSVDRISEQFAAMARFWTWQDLHVMRPVCFFFPGHFSVYFPGSWTSTRTCHFAEVLWLVTEMWRNCPILRGWHGFLNTEFKSLLWCSYSNGDGWHGIIISEWLEYLCRRRWLLDTLDFEAPIPARGAKDKQTAPLFQWEVFATLAGWDHTIYQLFQHTLGGLLFKRLWWPEVSLTFGGFQNIGRNGCYYWVRVIDLDHQPWRQKVRPLLKT